MKLPILFIILLHQVAEGFACRSRALNPSRQDAIAVWDYYVKYNKKDGPIKTLFSANKKEQYGRWLLMYMHKKLLLPPPIEWPQPPMFQEWVGWGNGEEGQNPPPWAVNRNSHGKPKYCLVLPEFGTCKENKRNKITRWGFDSLAGKCVEFKWSGCGGNQNRFLTQTICEKACGTMMHGEPGCCGRDNYREQENVFEKK